MAKPDCFPRVCQQIFEVVARTLRFMGARSDDIDDVAQRLALRIWQTWDEPHIVTARYRPRSSWEGYLARAARNEYYSLLRSEGRRTGREQRYADLPFPCEPRPGTIRHTPTEPDEVEQVLGWKAIRAEIDKLSTPRRRTIVRLSLLHQLSPNEIADRLGINSRTVRQHLTDGLEELRQRLSQPPGD